MRIRREALQDLSSPLNDNGVPTLSWPAYTYVYFQLKNYSQTVVVIAI